MYAKIIWLPDVVGRKLGSDIPYFYELITAPATKILDRWFESEPLKATLATDAVIGAMISPHTAGSRYKNTKWWKCNGLKLSFIKARLVAFNNKCWKLQCYLLQACAGSFALWAPKSGNIISMLVIVIKSINHQSNKPWAIKIPCWMMNCKGALWLINIISCVLLIKKQTIRKTKLTIIFLYFNFYSVLSLTVMCCFTM